MAKFEGYKDIYVFVEQKNGTIAEVGYELISEARKLVASIPEMGYQVVGVLLGSNITDKAQEVIVHGADKVIVVDDELLKDQPMINLPCEMNGYMVRYIRTLGLIATKI